VIIGVVREIKNNENRVSVVPSGVETLVRFGHTVLVETGAGLGTGIADEEYRKCGAEIADTSADIWSRSDLVCKVKEPLPEEWEYIRRDQILFTYFHFAASRALSEAMLGVGATCVAYETVEAADGTLPLLTPMSEIAGKMAMQEAAKYLERPQGGRGILLGGVPGVPAAHGRERHDHGHQPGPPALPGRRAPGECHDLFLKSPAHPRDPPDGRCRHRGRFDPRRESAGAGA
jgi:alanine dehydrogenase